MKELTLFYMILIAFLTITSIFLQVKYVLAGSLPENRGKYLLVEVPDGKIECSGEGLGQCPKEHFCGMPPDGATVGECVFHPALQEICGNKKCNTTEECEMWRDQEPRTGCLWDFCHKGTCSPYLY